MTSVTSLSVDFDAAHAYKGVAFRDRLPIEPTLLHWLSIRALTQGSAPYMTFVPASGEAETLTYGALEHLAGRLACWMRRKIGAGPGKVVALLAVNDLPSVLAIFAILRTGAAILLQSADDPPDRIRQQCAALDALRLLHSPHTAAPLDGATVLPDPARLPESDEVWPEVMPFADAFYFGTSGSTAVSKLVAQSHYNAAANAEAVRRHHGLGPGDRFLGCLPIHHVNGLHFTVLGALAAGAHAILAHGFDALRYPRLVETYRPCVASAAPPILEALLATWRDAVLPAEFRYFVSAAAPLTRDTARGVSERLNTRVLQGYGLTETVNFSATMPRGLSDATYARLMLDAETPSIGVALYGNEMAILGPDLQLAAPGEIGELCMRGHNVMMRYAGNEAATAEAFRGGWFHSQDLGFAVEDEGRCFFVITGRIKNVAKVAGRAVSLEEMDRVLRALPHVVDAACIAIPDVLLGEKIIAAVVLSEPVEDAILRAGLAKVFARGVLPARFQRLPVLPRTPTGKILRPGLTTLIAD